MKIELKILDDRIKGLTYAKPGDAAVDLRASSINGTNLLGLLPFTLMPGKTAKVGTGVAVHLASMAFNGEPLCESEFSVAGLVVPRSGLGSKGIRLANTVGVCDSQFQGEIILALENAGDEPFSFNALDRLAQYMIVPVFRPDFVVVSEFSASSERGESGFGSSGRG